MPSRKRDTLEWLSIMQHHGAPTRLLDFSLSFYIALYFSIVHALKESSVYCLNKDLIFQEGKERSKLRCDTDFEYGTKEYCNYLLSKSIRNPLVLLIEPYNLHERLSRQQGIFAIPFEIRQAFEYNLSLTASSWQKDLPASNKIKNYDDCIPMLNKDYILLKVNIPKSFHNEIIKDLKLMNITSETLFPGIDGFTKSLSNEFDL